MPASSPTGFSAYSNRPPHCTQPPPQPILLPPDMKLCLLEEIATRFRSPLHISQTDTTVTVLRGQVEDVISASRVKMATLEGNDTTAVPPRRGRPPTRAIPPPSQSSSSPPTRAPLTPAASGPPAVCTRAGRTSRLPPHLQQYVQNVQQARTNVSRRGGVL